MNETGRRALLVADPQRGGAREVAAYAAALEAGGMTIVRRECERREDVGEVVHAARREVDCVVLAGGDAMLGAAAIALRDTGLPLGILPLGNADGLARTMGIARQPAAAAAVILAGNRRTLDVGSVNGRPFFTVASIGLSADAADKLDRAARGRLGALGFAGTALRIALGQRRFSAILRCDNDVHRVRAMQISVRNTWSEPREQPGRRGSDRLLDVRSVEPDTRWHLMVMPEAFGDVTAGLQDGLRVARCKVVEVVTRVPQSVRVDGDVVTVTPARFSILREAVTVFVPERRTRALIGSDEAVADAEPAPQDATAARGA